MNSPQTNQALILDLIEDFIEGTHDVIKNLSLAALQWRADAEANSIGLTMWHVSRVFDVFKTRLLEGKSPDEELWHINGWRDKTGYDPRGIGWDGFGNLAGYTQAEVAMVPILPSDDQLAYFDEVATALLDWLKQTSDEALQQRSIGFPQEEMSSYQWLKFGILIDTREHLGEMKALKAMWERRN
ncbi:MAG: DinB family protein [Chloroflexota bacterium]